MELNDRKKLILKAIIANYLETGEPVGSRTIAKHPELNLSSATIRNEMADLEDMGYILQPHTSAGRIPSDTGYRFYVDQLMTERDSEHEEKQALIQRVDKMEVLLKQVANALAKQHELCNDGFFPTLSECNTEICSAVSGGSRTSACSDRYTRQYRKEQDDPGRRTAFE